MVGFDIFLFFWGLFIGSFLGVLIERLPRGEQVTTGRSHCDFCGHTLAKLDLIPLFSWVGLRGRCRYCRKRLPPFYPIVELITGITFALIGYTVFAGIRGASPEVFPQWLLLIYWIFLSSAFIVIFFADLRYRIIPDAVLFPAIIVVALWRLMEWYMLGIPFLTPLLAGSAAFGIFLLIFLLSRGKGMGFGDVKLVFLLGLLLGSPRVIVALYAAFLTGAIVGVILILGKKRQLGQTIAFGPFLIFGTVIALMYGDQIVSISRKFLF